MPQQQNPERGPGDASPGAPERPRNNGHRTAGPDVPRLPQQRHQVPSRPPAHATPPGGQRRTAAPTAPGSRPRTPGPTSPGGTPSAGRPTRVMPGPGTPEPAPQGAGPARSGPSSGGSGGSDGGPGTSAAGSGGATTVTKKEPDLSFNKVAAGAGAAIVTAVLGSFLGAVGTILGAALGSIITTFATTLFQRSIERTRTQVVDKTHRIRERSGQRGGPGVAVWQNAARDGAPDSQETVRIDASALAADSAPVRSRRFRMSRKSILLSAAGAVLAFGLAMFLVTGIEWVKGSTITGGGSGTSIGNVVQGAPTQRQNDDQSGSSPSTSQSTTSTGESDSERSGQSTSTSENDGSTSPDTSPNPLQDGLNRVLPSQSPQSGQLQNGQNGGSNNGSGGANSTN